ncbi:TonB-dependent siderophore receptor [Flavitalea flava]
MIGNLTLTLIKRIILPVFCLWILIPAFANEEQQGLIKGQVKTVDGKPAASVTVQVKNTKIVTFTDEDGFFYLRSLKPGTYLIIVSHTGLQTQEKQVVITTNESREVQFSLQETLKELDAVVIQGRRSNNLHPVSVGKINISPMDLPQTIGIVSNKVIRDQQASRLGDVLKNVSGVSLTQQRGGVAETFSSRGYSIGVGGSGGSIFKNGVITNTMGFPEASTLESIEVLKGSSALLYGNVSGGLVINMVTKKPKFDFGGEISMRAGSNNLYKPIIDLYGPVTKDLAFRVIGTYENAGSYRDQVKTKRTYVNPSLLYKLGSKTTLLVQGDYLYADFTPDNGIGVLNQNMDPIIPGSRSRFINTSWAYYHLDQKTGSVNLDHVLNDNWKINFIASSQNTRVNSFGTNVPNAIAANGDWKRGLSRVKSGEKDYTAQLNLTGNFKTSSFIHQLLVGTDAVRIETETNAFQITSGGVAVSTYDSINILNPGKYTARTDIPDTWDTARTTSPSYRLGYYAQDLITVTEKIKVLAGLRWTYQKTLQTTILNQAGHSERKGTAAAADNKAFSPKLAIIYQPVKTTSVFASYSNNFIINTGVDIYGSQISPSIVDQYELGVKNEILKGKLSANLSLYRIVNHNFAQQAAAKADGTVNSDVNVKELTGETTSDGLEIDINGSFSRNFYFITGYGYNYMRYTKTSPVKGSFVEGERLTNNPAHTANASLFYTFDMPRLRGIKIGASAFYTGARNGGNNNTFGQTPAYNRLIPLTGFTTIDLSAGYTYRQVTLLAKLSNLTNTLNYVVHDRYSVNPIPPRQLIATLSYRF